MKLYIKPEDITLVNYKLSVKNEDGQDVYKIASVSDNLMRYKWKMWDTNDNELMVVEQKKALTMMAVNFDVIIGGQHVMDIMQKVKFTKYFFQIPQYDITIDGDFISHVFNITQKGNVVAKIQRKILSWGDCYEIDISDPSYEMTVLAAVIAVECMVIISRNRRRRRR